MKRLLSLFHRPLHRYLLIGGSVYVFELGVILVAQRLGATAVAAVALSFVLGTLVSFLLQKLVTFGDKRMHHRILLSQFVATCLLVAWNFAFTVLVTQALQHVLAPVFSRTLALGITTIWNYYLYKTRIFRSAEALDIPVNTPKRAKTTGSRTGRLTVWLQQLAVRLDDKLHHSTIRWVYMGACAGVLAVTVAFWAALGARLHSVNADQLVDPYLFSNAASFHGANFPGAHSFLLKWPLFWLIGILGTTPSTLLYATVALCVLTVGILAYILWRIDRRPLVFGTVCLVLTLILLLVPPQAYAGALLPVNMAMLTTRNIEYIVYVAGVWLLIRASGYHSWRFWAGSGLLTVLFASDKLFVSLSAGGALLMLVAYAFWRSWNLVTTATRWLLGTLGAFAVATILLAVINWSGVTHITLQSGAAGPYTATQTPKDMALGVIYAAMGLLTNLGANPAFDATQPAHIPAEAVHRMTSPGAAAFVLAFAVVCATGFAIWHVVRPTVVLKRGRPPVPDKATLLSVALLASTAAALGVFIASKHYYAVDARYLVIGLLAGAVTAVTYARRRRWRPSGLILTGVVTGIGILGAAYTTYDSYAAGRAALATTTQRNQAVVAALAHHKVSTLVGDYWRVLPIRSLSDGKQAVLPLSTCVQPRVELSSRAWQSDLRHTSFAYLLSSDQGLTDFPPCSLDEVIAQYGRPNSSVLISGSLELPHEQLLFFDHGTQSTLPYGKQAFSGLSSLAPIAPEDIPGANCLAPTVMTVVAHEDDDLLFTSPDLVRSIQAGNCVRTVFLTAGDAGHKSFYWLNRQLGAEAAYATMLGTNDVWVQRTVRLAAGEYVTVSSPRGNPKVSLIFFNLPDGNIDGRGFRASSNGSLAKLHEGAISMLRAVDAQSTYTASGLTQALATLMETYQPAEIRTQADVYGGDFPDHSDHIATGQFTSLAAKQYDHQQYNDAVSVPVRFYVGYPVRNYPANVEGDDLREKEAAFLAYAKFDGGVCSTVEACEAMPTYGAYLLRQYTDDSVPY